MKTLLITLEFPPFKGGVANYYGNLASHWPKNQDFFVWHKNYPGRFSKYLLAFRSLWREIKKKKIDYLLVGQILPLGTLALALKKILNLKYSVFLHGLDLSLALKKPKLSQRILTGSHKIICANSQVKKNLLVFYPELQKKVFVVTPGAQMPEKENFSLEKVEALKEKEGLQNKLILFSLGRLVERKGFDMVIKALEFLKPENKERLVYCIAGKGEDEARLKALAQNKEVRFLGELSEEEKWSWLHLADIFIMPSRDISGDFEGFGIVYLEANLAGTAVIAGDSGGVRDAVADNLNGLLVDPLDPKKIALAIETLLSNQALRLRLGEEGRLRAQQEFSWKTKVNELFTGINS